MRTEDKECADNPFFSKWRCMYSVMNGNIVERERTDKEVAGHART